MKEITTMNTNITAKAATTEAVQFPALTKWYGDFSMPEGDEVFELEMDLSRPTFEEFGGAKRAALEELRAYMRATGLVAW